MKAARYLRRLTAITLASATCLATVATAQSTAVNQNTIKKQRAARQAQANNPNAQRLGDIEPINQVLGRAVQGPNGERIGTLQNVVLDLESGRVLYGVVNLSQGKTVAVPPAAFSPTPGNAVRMKVPVAQIANAPTFKAGGEIGSAQFLNQVYQHFGLSPWWQGGDKPADQGSFNNVHLAKNLTGMRVQGVSDQPIGTVRTAMLDLPAGRVVYVILDPVNNLQLGNNLYALPPQSFTRSASGNMLTSDVNRDKLAGAPKFPRTSNWPNLADRQYITRVYQYYGKDPYFATGGGALQPTGGAAQSVFPNQSQPEDQGGWVDESDSSISDDPNWANDDEAQGGSEGLWEDEPENESWRERRRERNRDLQDRYWDRQQDRNSDPYDRDRPSSNRRNRLQERD